MLFSALMKSAEMRLAVQGAGLKLLVGSARLPPA